MEFQLSDYDDLKEMAEDLKKSYQSKNRIKGIDTKILTYDKAIELAEDLKKQYELENKIIDKEIIVDNQTSPDRRYVGVQYLMKYLDCPEPTLRDWIRLRKIPFSKMGKLIRFDLQRIDQWLKEKAVDN